MLLPSPDFSHESEHPGLTVAGVDEAGRGPLAGPVVAACVILDRSKAWPGINDSKKLKPAQREELAAHIRRTAVCHAVAQASVEEIDSLNILHASMLAMKRAVEAMGCPPQVALIDGNRAPDLACSAVCIVMGDARSLSIAAASILAKVERDAIMRELGAAHPAYGFERHAGYGTAAHLRALEEHGPTPHHRVSFAPVRLALEKRREAA